MTRKTNRVNGREYHYYYCPTGKKHGCTNPVMLKENKLIAGAVLQVFGFEVCNQLLIGDFCDLS